MDEQETREARWTYAGRRLDRSGKIHRVWIKEDGQEGWYSDKAKAAVVGGIYSGTVSTDGGTMYGAGSWAYTGENVDDELRAQLQVLDSDAGNRQRAKAAEKRTASSGPLDEAMADLEKLAKACRTVEDMDALQRVVARRLWAAWS